MPRKPSTPAEIDRGRRLGQLIKRERDAKSISAEDLARAVQCSVETIRKVEGGSVANPGFFTVAAIAEALDTALPEMAKSAAPGGDS